MTDDIMFELARPFPDRYIHENPSGGGSYVKHHVVEQRLIHILGRPPIFTMVEVVRGRVEGITPDPSAKSKRWREGRPTLESAIVGVIARMEIEIKGEQIIVDEAGDCEDPHNWGSDGGRLKDAMSDAYKRCAMRLGCGLHLWSQGEYFLFDKLQQEAAPPLHYGSAIIERPAAGSDEDAPAPAQPTLMPAAEKEPQGEALATKPQLDKIRLSLMAHKIINRDDRLKEIGRRIGRKVKSSTELTRAEAVQLIDSLAESEPA